MKTIIERIQMLPIATQNKVQTFIHDESGDTNFISIIVVLGIALGVAVVFMNFRTQIVDTASGIIEDFLGVFN